MSNNTFERCGLKRLDPDVCPSCGADQEFHRIHPQRDKPFDEGFMSCKRCDAEWHEPERVVSFPYGEPIAA